MDFSRWTELIILPPKTKEEESSSPATADWSFYIFTIITNVMYPKTTLMIDFKNYHGREKKYYKFPTESSTRDGRGSNASSPLVQLWFDHFKLDWRLCQIPTLQTRGFLFWYEVLRVEAAKGWSWFQYQVERLLATGNSNVYFWIRKCILFQ